MNKKKIIIISIISVLVLIIVSLVGIKLYNEYKLRHAKLIIVLEEDLTLEVGSKKKLSDYIVKINGKITNDSYLDSSKLGKQEVIVEYTNDDGYDLSYKFNIEVVDSTAPIIWLSGSYRLPKGSKTKLTDKILCGDNYDAEPKCYIEGEYDVNKVGEYALLFKAEDKSGNIAEEPFILKIYEPYKPNTNISNNNTTTTTPKRTDFQEIKSIHKTDKTKIGIDVSKWQGTINFDKLKEAGVEFIIIRLGGTRGTDGEYFIDEKFERNIKEAKRVGIPVGLYFFSYGNSVGDAVRDALWVSDQIKDYDIELPIAFDWEDWSYYNEYKMSFIELTGMPEAFNYILNMNGYKSMLYSSKSYLEYIWLDTDLDIWLAHYTKQTTYKGKYKFWQLCDNGKVDGINGNVDIDIMYLD